MITTLLQNIGNLFRKPRYMVIYAPERLGGGLETYIVNNPATCTPLLKSGVKVGFISRCHNREGAVRGFRFDRVKSVCKV